MMPAAPPMKNSLLYGFLMAIAGFILTLALYLLGMHSDPAKMPTASLISEVLGALIMIVCIVLGVRAARGAVPAEQGYSYGRGVGSGMGISLVSAAVGLVTTPLYVMVINPQFTEVIMELQRSKMAEKGLNDDQIEQALKIMKIFSSPGFLTVSAFLSVLFFGLVISLIVAAFLRSQPAQPPAGSPAPAA